MIGVVGKILINAAFLSAILAAIGYFLYSKKGDDRYFRWSSILFGVQGLLLVISGGLLLYLMLHHRFNYYYVFEYTSRDLPLKYLISAFWGGQEGSFMLWMFFATLIGFGLMKWTRKPYLGPVLFFLTLTQVFLFSMIAGIHFGGFTLGASPFRTLAESMPNAPFLQANPNFVPSDGKGLNVLLQSPWMVIHPPILFFGFSMMTVPYCFAMAALWRRKYREWINPALPWTLAANLCLLTAIFLGGYWAYNTLSFGGYWAWDPVENASLVPWLFGTAGIHMMIIQKKNSTAKKSSIIFALLAYVGVVYETFLTRSGILGDSSVHSFVDLGLYNQLLVFMAIITIICAGMVIARYKELPGPKEEAPLLSREFMLFSGSMVLLLLGIIIALGTSSPIIGKLFVAHPTPPEVSYYNNWTMPLAIIAAFLTVAGQYLFWKKYDADSLARALTLPLVLACALALATIMLAHVRSFYSMIFILAGWFAFAGNGIIVIRLIWKKPKLIGGALSHVGFGVALLGILASSVYSSNLLDASTRSYNAAVGKGEMKNAKGGIIRQKANFVELKLNQPKVVNNRYRLTYEGYTLKHQSRSGQQQYRIKVQPIHGGSAFYLKPKVYPMKSAHGGKIQWSVDPDIKNKLSSDIYLYVAGSSYVEHKNKLAQHQGHMQAVSETVDVDSAKTKVQTIKLKQGQATDIGGFHIQLNNFHQTQSSQLPDSTVVAVQAGIKVTHTVSNDTHVVHPIFAIFKKNGKSWSYSPPRQIPGEDVSIEFSKINPKNGKATLLIHGIDQSYKQPWVLVIAKEKPFIWVLWCGIFICMAGFSVSILRHWSRERKKQQGLAAEA